MIEMGGGMLLEGEEFYDAFIEKLQSLLDKSKKITANFKASNEVSEETIEMESELTDEFDKLVEFFNEER